MGCFASMCFFYHLGTDLLSIRSRWALVSERLCLSGWSPSPKLSSKKLKAKKPSPMGVDEVSSMVALLLVAKRMCSPVGFVVEKVTKQPFAARCLSSLSRGFTRPCAGNDTRRTRMRVLDAISGVYLR